MAKGESEADGRMRKIDPTESTPETLKAASDVRSEPKKTNDEISVGRPKNLILKIQHNSRYVELLKFGLQE